MKSVAILGSTGSIGLNTLDVIRRYPKEFRVVALTAYNNTQLLIRQVREFSPCYAAINNAEIVNFKKQLGSHKIRIMDACCDLSQIVSLPEVDIVVIGMSGRAALEPFLAAARCGKRIAPANKEALVIAGQMIMRAAKKNNAEIIPVDSEQSAIFQCLEGQNRKELKKIHLTASGGPLARIPKSRFDKLTVRQILKHPRWKMGAKITVDSATLMNKGFEVIEAIRLFDLTAAQVEVLVHPQAIIHSMVSFRDGSILAQLGATDMRLPIQYALTYPQRWKNDLPSVDFVKLKELTFEEPDVVKFPALALAFEAARKGETFPCVLNAADEEAVSAFLKGRIPFTSIYRVVEKVFTLHRPKVDPTLQDIAAVDAWAREAALQAIARVCR